MLKFRLYQLKCNALDYQGCEDSLWEITVCLVIVKKKNSNLIAAIPKLYSMID